MSLRRVTAGAYVFSSDEEAEAKPMESEVVGIAEFNIQLYKIKFVYSLRQCNFVWRLHCLSLTTKVFL